MLRLCVLLAILCWARAAITPTPSKSYTHTVVLDSSNDVHLFWEFDALDITFELHAATTGWVGLGISPTGGMSGADIAVGWVDNNSGVTSLYDAFAAGRQQPTQDASDDLTLLMGQQYSAGGTQVTQLKWKRSQLSCDSVDDVDILDGTVRLIWAYGAADPASYSALAYHGAGQRGSKSLRLLEPSGASSNIPANAQSLRFLNPNYTIPTKQTTYWCQVFQFPTLASKNHIIQIKPVIQSGNEAIVHHIILYRCFLPVNASLHGYGQECYTSNMPGNLSACFHVMTAWAIGGGDFNFPSHVGYPVGGGHGPGFIFMETHYDNPTGIQGRRDASGLELVVTPTTRQFDAGVIQTGDSVTNTQIIPPAFSGMTDRGFCSSQCLTAAMGSSVNSIKMFASIQHAHLLGKQVHTRVVRNGVEVTNIGSDKYYDFNLQEARLLPSEVEIFPSDHIVVDCIYDSTNRSSVTYGGLGTTDEMCLSFVLYYPTLNLTACESAPTHAEIMTHLGVTSINWATYPNPTATAPPSLAGLTMTTILGQTSWNSATTRNSFQNFLLSGSTLRSLKCVKGGTDLLSGQISALGSVTVASDPVAICGTCHTTGSLALLLAAAAAAAFRP